MKKRQKLPSLVDPQLSMRLQPKLTDAKAVTAFSQEQRRRVKQGKTVSSTSKRALGRIFCQEVDAEEKESQPRRAKRQRRAIRPVNQNPFTEMISFPSK